MKVFRLKTNPQSYSSNVYYIQGTWNKLDDINTLVDAGSDDYYFDELERISHGLGKRKVEKVVLTHLHFDHTGGVKYLLKSYNPVVYSINIHNDYQKNNIRISRVLKDNDIIKMGDRTFVVLSTPGHSNDSICLYSEEEGILFTGDLPIQARVPDQSYTKEYFDSIQKLVKLSVKTIYPGHGEPFTNDPGKILRMTYETIKSSKII